MASLNEGTNVKISGIMFPSPVALNGHLIKQTRCQPQCLDVKLCNSVFKNHTRHTKVSALSGAVSLSLSLFSFSLLISLICSSQALQNVTLFNLPPKNVTNCFIRQGVFIGVSCACGNYACVHGQVRTCPQCNYNVVVPMFSLGP